MTALVTVFVPPLPSLQGTTFEEQAIINGNQVPKQYHQRVHNGHNVIDVPFGLLQRLLGGPMGLHWQNANPEVLIWMGEADRRSMSCNAFPGQHRQAPLSPPLASAKIALEMKAPEGVSSFSHNGRSYEVGKDGTIEVEGPVVEIARSHGFRAVSQGRNA